MNDTHPAAEEVQLELLRQATPARRFALVRSMSEKLDVNYLVGGSVASSALGVARTTLDVDLVADLALEHAPVLVRALRRDYHIDQDMIEDAIRRRASFNVVHLETMLKVDVFVLKVQRDALDGDHLVRCAAEIGVLDLLRRACAEAGLPELLP